MFLIKGDLTMINAIVLFGWTIIMLFALAFITIYVGEHLDD